MNSIDLFSGIGGIAWALRGIVKPKLYCEIDPVCQKILKRNMKKARLLPAPIIQDVCDLKPAEDLAVDTKIDMITAGFPCIGFSNMGHHNGFQNDQSSLFCHVVRLTREVQPSFVFMENVPPILKMGMKHVIEEFTALGYSLRWCIVGGIDVGARQVRRRWFCLATRNDVQSYHIDFSRQYNKVDWSVEGASRMKLQRDPADLRRSRTLGNAVIPDAVRYAFLYLYSGGRIPPADLNLDSETAKWVPVPVTASSDINMDKHSEMDEEDDSPIPTRKWQYPRDGCCFSAHTIKPFANNPREHTKCHIPIWKPLVFSPDCFKAIEGARVSPKRASPLIKEPVQKKLWFTPRYSSVTTSSLLTERCLRDLPTQLRFEIDTPDDERIGRMNPEFVEWLMGYPLGWTWFPGRKNIPEDAPEDALPVVTPVIECHAG